MSEEGHLAIQSKYDAWTLDQIFKSVEDGQHADPAFVLLEIKIYRGLERLISQNREALQLMLKIHKTLDAIAERLKK